MIKIDKKRRILILGGTGFIGSKLVEELVKQNQSVNLLVYGRIPQYFRNKKITIFKGNVINKKTLIPAVKNSDIILNLVGTFNEDISTCLLNLVSAANVLKVAREHNPKIEKVIFISSEAVYGECQGVPRNEEDLPSPVTEYGFSKYLAEEMCKFFSKRYKIPIIILRLSNTYGPGNRVGVISECINSVLKNRPVKIHRDGKQQRDFLYVDDAVQGIIKSLSHQPKKLDIFNISGKRAYSLLELIALIEKNIKRKVKIIFLPPKAQDIKYMCASYKKANRFLKYQPKIGLEEGIAKTINYYKFL